MIHSMTAYARKEFKGDWGTAVWEIRSVNQRYLETYIRLPEQLRSLEPVLRERFRAKLQRGKVECNLRFEAAQAAASQLHINEELAKLIIDSANWVMKEAGQGQLNPRKLGEHLPGATAAAVGPGFAQHRLQVGARGQDDPPRLLQLGQQGLHTR